MRGLNKKEYAGGLGAAIMGLCLYSYDARELLTFLVLFTMAFLLLTVVAFGGFVIWFASANVAIRTAPASRRMIALSHRFIFAHTRA